MSKHRYVVTAHGRTFKRSTDRVYTHLVIGRVSPDRDIAAARACEKSDRVNHAYFVREANPATREHERSPADQAEMDAAALLTVEDYVAQKLAARLAAIETRRAQGYYESFFDLGWAGRADLAAKNASAHRNRGYVDIEIIPVPAPPRRPEAP